jgi:hypothetical protein
VTRSGTQIRFPTDLHQQLREAAETHGLPINYLVTKAVEEFLENLLPPDQVRLTRQDSDHAREAQ